MLVPLSVLPTVELAMRPEPRTRGAGAAAGEPLPSPLDRTRADEGRRARHDVASELVQELHQFGELLRCPPLQELLELLPDRVDQLIGHRGAARAEHGSRASVISHLGARRTIADNEISCGPGDEKAAL